MFVFLTELNESLALPRNEKFLFVGLFMCSLSLSLFLCFGPCFCLSHSPKARANTLAPRRLHKLRVHGYCKYSVLDVLLSRKRYHTIIHSIVSAMRVQNAANLGAMRSHRFDSSSLALHPAFLLSHLKLNLICSNASVLLREKVSCYVKSIK